MLPAPVRDSAPVACEALASFGLGLVATCVFGFRRGSGTCEEACQEVCEEACQGVCQGVCQGGRS